MRQHRCSLNQRAPREQTLISWNKLKTERNRIMSLVFARIRESVCVCAHKGKTDNKKNA